MSATNDFTLAPEERQAISEEWQRIQSEPARLDRREIGCMTVIVAIVLALAGPFLLRWLGIELHPGMKIALGAVLALAILGGAFVGLVLVSGRYAHAYRKAEAALAWLAQNGAGGDPAERRKQAVSLLYHAYCVDGPSTTNTIKFEDARARLSDALPYVMAVERALRVDRGIYPVFTDGTVKLPA